MSEINGDVKIRVIDSDKLIEAINEGSCDINLSAIMALGAAMMDTKKQEPISDLINRQAAIDAITSYNGVVDKSVAKRILIQLPPAQSEPALEHYIESQRIGKWIRNDNGTWSCNKCNSWIPDEQHHYARFCLYCGAKMEERRTDEQ